MAFSHTFPIGLGVIRFGVSCVDLKVASFLFGVSGPSIFILSTFYIHLWQSHFYELPHFQGGTPGWPRLSLYSHLGSIAELNGFWESMSQLIITLLDKVTPHVS
jgi:hypothetical protein